MNNIDLVFGEGRVARTVIVLGYIVSVIAGVFLGFQIYLPAILLFLASLGMIVLGTLREHKEEQEAEDGSTR